MAVGRGDSEQGCMYRQPGVCSGSGALTYAGPQNSDLSMWALGCVRTDSVLFAGMVQV